MSTRYFFLLFFTGALNLTFAQEKLSFSDQQLKLSFGPLNGQPNFFEFYDFEWSKGFGISLEYNIFAWRNCQKLKRKVSISDIDCE